VGTSFDISVAYRGAGGDTPEGLPATVVHSENRVRVVLGSSVDVRIENTTTRDGPGANDLGVRSFIEFGTRTAQPLTGNPLAHRMQLEVTNSGEVEWEITDTMWPAGFGTGAAQLEIIRGIVDPDGTANTPAVPTGNQIFLNTQTGMLMFAHDLQTSSILVRARLIGGPDEGAEDFARIEWRSHDLAITSVSGDGGSASGTTPLVITLTIGHTPTVPTNAPQIIAGRVGFPASVALRDPRHQSESTGGVPNIVVGTGSGANITPNVDANLVHVIIPQGTRAGWVDVEIRSEVDPELFVIRRVYWRD
jgi:hypothetical protein